MFNICIASLILSIWCVTLFFEKSIGLSMLLFIVPLTCYIIYILQKNSKVENPKAKILIIPITLLSSTYFIFNNSFFNGVNKFVIPVLIIIMILGLFKEKFKFNILSKIFLVLFIPLSCVGETLKKLKICLLDRFKINYCINKDGKIKKILKSILMTIPIVLIIVLLLSSADEIFGSIFSNIFEAIANAIGKIEITSVLMKFILIICSFGYLLSFFNYLISDYEKENIEESNKQINDNFTIKMILTTLNIIYLIFCYIQIKSLFMKKVEINYAEYARQGFFQLMIVSVINLVAILIAKKRQNENDLKTNSYINIMSLIMIVFTFIILVSSAVRMYFYESAYGYTILRLLVYCALLIESLLLIPTVMFVVDKRINLAKTYFIIIITVYICMNFANFDNIIAKRNVDRYVETGKIDMYYLRTETGTDAINQIIRILDVDTDDNYTREHALKYLESIYDELQQKEFDIREYNISENRAKYFIENKFNINETEDKQNINESSNIIISNTSNIEQEYQDVEKIIENDILPTPDRIIYKNSNNQYIIITPNEAEYAKIYNELYNRMTTKINGKIITEDEISNMQTKGKFIEFDYNTKSKNFIFMFNNPEIGIIKRFTDSGQVIQTYLSNTQNLESYMDKVVENRIIYNFDKNYNYTSVIKTEYIPNDFDQKRFGVYQKIIQNNSIDYENTVKLLKLNLLETLPKVDFSTQSVIITISQYEIKNIKQNIGNIKYEFGVRNNEFLVNILIVSKVVNSNCMYYNIIDVDNITV